VNEAGAWPCLSARAEGSLLRVAVVPNARRTGADGLHDGALRVRLAAQPVEGQANARLLAWLAAELGCARRAVRLQRGDASRRKAVEIDLPAAAVADWLARVVVAAAAKIP
jgi:uncharacterized protein (TIGR00251 family)